MSKEKAIADVAQVDAVLGKHLERFDRDFGMSGELYLSALFVAVGKIAKALLNRYNGEDVEATEIAELREQAPIAAALILGRFNAIRRYEIDLIEVGDVAEELVSARSFFPSSAHAFAALIEEIGETEELASPTLDANEHRAETVQAVAMLVRLVTEGDPAFAPAKEVAS